MSVPFRFSLFAWLVAAIGLATFAGLPASAQEDKVVATVNGVPITEAEMKLVEEDLAQQFARLPEDQRRAAVLSAIMEFRLLAGEAAAKGVDKDPAFMQRMELLRQRALHAAVVESEVAQKITDEEIRARYDAQIAATPPVNEVKARHILVKTQEEALAIVKRLEAGEKFEDIAKAVSTDPGSGANGGDLGWFGPGQMVPEFEKAAFGLEVGAYTKEPVQSQFGFHIILVEDKRTQQPPAFEEVKDQFRSMVLREKYFALVKTLRGAATIDIPDAALKKAVEDIEKVQ